MAQLYVIRHGQASFLSRDYDNLSELGYEQGRRLARHWLRWNIQPTRIICGPRRRHQQTYSAFAEEYNRVGRQLPQPEVWPEFDEYAADAVMRAGLAQIVPNVPELQRALAAMQQPNSNRERHFQRIFEHVTRAWVQGQFKILKVENFAEFRQRVGAGFEKLLADAHSGASIAVFTSGGPVAANMGYLLDLPDEKTLELSWMVRNAAYNEILFSKQRRSLLSFASTAHLDEPQLLTFR